MRNIDKIIKISTLLMFCFYLNWFSNDRNYINYDAIPYVASAFLVQNSDVDEAFKYSWGLLKKTVDKNIYQDLCCANDYRKSMSADKSAFESHLPSYQTKSGYVYMIRFASDLMSINEYDAIKVISQIASLLIVILLAMSFFREHLAIYLSIFPILVLLEILQLSRLMTPDAVIGLLMLISAYLLSKNKLPIAYSLLISSILLRQTNILFVGILSFIKLYKKQHLSFCVLSISALCIYGLNSFYFSSLGYWKTFHSSLIYMPNTFVNYNPEFSFEIYMKLLLDKFFWILSDTYLSKLITVMGINIAMGIFFLRSKFIKISYFGKLSLIFSLGTLAAFVLIPFPDFRIYAGPLIASSFLILKAIAKTKNLQPN
jgi:hypothetical protein